MGATVNSPAVQLMAPERKPAHVRSFKAEVVNAHTEEAENSRTTDTKSDWTALLTLLIFEKNDMGMGLRQVVIYNGLFMSACIC